MANDWDTVKKMISDAALYLREKKTLDTIGKYNADTVKKRTRLGKGVDQTLGPQTKLKIKQSTKKTRQGLKSKGKLSI